MNNADASQLTQAARRNGMRNLREDGWMKDPGRRDHGGRSDARHAGILMATFFFRAVASDGKMRSGSLTRR